MNSLEKQLKSIAFNETIKSIVNQKDVYVFLYNNFNDSEKAEISLVAEGECEISEATGKKINRLVTELLSCTNPEVLEMLQTLKNELQ